MLAKLRNHSLANSPAASTNRLTPVFDRVFDDFFAPITSAAWSGAPLSVWEDENNVYVQMDLPGVEDKDIDVSIQGDQLMIQGERKSEQRQGGYDSRSYGRFEQLITLSSPVNADQVDARLANGVLSLTCPKSEEAKPRKIAIKA